jgi:hypothetical protein
MRRAHCEIKDPQEMERILDAATVGRMATLDAQGYPYVTPVNFVYYKGAIYFHCAPQGEKLDNIRRDPRVCFEVDVPLSYVAVSFNPERNPCRTHQLYRCVIIRGRAAVLPGGDLKAEVLNALVAKHEGSRDFTPITPASAAYEKCLVVEIRPERMTGKADLAQNKPHDGERRDLARHLLDRGLPGDLEAVRAMGYGVEADPSGGWRLAP